MTAREAILARVRTARAGPGEAAVLPGHGEAAGGYRVAGSLAPGSRMALFRERLEEYGVHVRRCATGEVANAVAAVLRARRASEVAVPLDLPAAWRPSGVTWLNDAASSGRAEHPGAVQLDIARLAEADGVLTGCAVAVAETGTLALDGGDAQGRRALTLVPDYHLCVVLADQVVETVPEAVRLLEPAAREGRPITLVSGPSATSDIELSRVAGVHGPRTLGVILVDADADAGEGAE